MKRSENNLVNANDAFDESFDRVFSIVKEQDALKLKIALIISELHKFNLIGNALRMFNDLKGNEECKDRMFQQFLIAMEFLMNIEDFFKENSPEDYKETFLSWKSLHLSYELFEDDVDMLESHSVNLKHTKSKPKE